jgi:hypothetical protein
VLSSCAVAVSGVAVVVSGGDQRWWWAVVVSGGGERWWCHLQREYRVVSSRHRDDRVFELGEDYLSVGKVDRSSHDLKLQDWRLCYLAGCRVEWRVEGECSSMH